MHLHPTLYPTTFSPDCSSDTSVGLERNIGKDFRRPLARSHKQGLSWLFHRKIPTSKSTEERWENQKGHKLAFLSPWNSEAPDPFPNTPIRISSNSAFSKRAINASQPRLPMSPWNSSRDTS
ncbi:hypothetical protein [Phaffia rhodozyma]|uniref:Uncharacterized protein n=1 Tax=Phaffia rhodozyma TaxID=264483 RepID=A0A0F7SMZ5_PHARH|nr:hypothetical protein [Phaffia rhodozyma]